MIIRILMMTADLHSQITHSASNLARRTNVPSPIEERCRSINRHKVIRTFQRVLLQSFPRAGRTRRREAEVMEGLAKQ
jgi:hypothetical protein